MTGPHEITDGDVQRAFRQAAAYAARTRTPHLVDEWESAALVGLADAAARHDPAGGLPFREWAPLAVARALVFAARLWRPKGYRANRRAVAAPAPAASLDDASHGPPLGGLVPDGREAVGWEAEYHDEVAGLARLMKPATGRAFTVRHTYARPAAAAFTAAGIVPSAGFKAVDRAHALIASHRAARWVPPLPRTHLKDAS